MAHVDVNLPNKPQGAKISIPGLGVFNNGEVAEVNDKKWRRFIESSPHRAYLADEGSLILHGPATTPSGPQAGEDKASGAVLGEPPADPHTPPEPPTEQALSYGYDNESSDEVLDANYESKEV
jgi:hypothetical protein